MKNILLTLCLLIIFKISFGQTNIFPTEGNAGVGTTSPTYKLDVLGSSRVKDGFLNSDNYFEKVLPDIAFANGVANLAVDLKLGNVPLWGYVEVEITSTYAYQNSVGKLTKVYAIGANPDGAIYTNESRVSDVVGTVGDNISFGDLVWDGVNSTYKIPISHIVSTGNIYTLKVKMFTNASVAKGVFDLISISTPYNLVALSKNYVSFNGNVGIGTSLPSEKLDVKGNLQVSGAIKYGNAGVRTESRNNAGLQGNEGALSGFYETYTPKNFPKDDGSWWHLIDSRHSNPANNYAMQIAGSFFDQKLFFRKTNSDPAQSWKEVVAIDANGRINLDNDAAANKKSVTIGGYVYGGAIRFNSNSAVANSRNLELGNLDNSGNFYPSMVVSSETGNVGIGTKNPENSEGWHKVLDVYGSSHSKIIATTADVQTGIWSHNAGFYSSPPGGIVGTKTNHPLSFITNGTNKLTITNDGNVGIGTTSPNSKLEVNGNTRINGNLNIFNTTYKLVGFDDPTNYYIGHFPVEGSAGLDLHWYGGIRLGDRTGNVMQITDGKIGIGTTDTKGYKLAVAGEMIAERVVVKLQTNWPDYVFSPNYKRSTLSEVEEYINKNHRLPNIPSAQEVADNGIDIGKMNAKLLEKMEEMTLYMIEQQKEIKALREEVKQIKEKK